MYVLVYELHARLMLRHRLDAVGLESEPGSSVLLQSGATDRASDSDSGCCVLELMLAPGGGKEIVGLLTTPQNDSAVTLKVAAAKL